MKAQIRAHMVGALVILGLTSLTPSAKAGPASACDQIAADVKAAIGKDPSKVLMIVEDALVINETCACEIVKAAITATNADGAMAQQIVQTALAVAPKMSAIIVECAESAAPGSAKAVEDVAKSDDKSEGTDFGAWATNIRGIYLIQPAAAGVVTQVVEPDDERDERPAKESDNDSNSRRRTRNLVPLSPAWANH